ncbi:MAG TPA: glycosyltransferase [Solirubrobacteraceae bacterium]|jgi:glycosyltransferase involved in cell wall biosynthesis|nr:glycosyltransferase [Solirubrobacteraceae bacterium]
MRVCVAYDCLFPYTVGGAERWYRSLAERLAADGHEVTYLTLRQWERGARLDLDPRVRVVVAGPRMALYTASGRRRIAPPLAFGAGVLWHLLRHGRRYDVVHMCSFPYFSLLAAALARSGPRARFALVVDWIEVWSAAYWREYLGPIGGPIGHAVQRLCARVPQRAFCFSRLHTERLRAEGLRSDPLVPGGLYVGTLAGLAPRAADPLVVFAGRLIPEKRAPLAVAAFALATARIEGLRGEFYGDGPERAALARAIEAHGVSEIASAPGFVEEAVVDAALTRALCMLSTSSREGYGMVVMEASARGTPSVVVAGEDNAAVELVQEGANGFLAASDDPETIAAAIVRVHEAGLALRERTAAWFAENAERESLEHSLRTVLASYASDGSGITGAPVHEAGTPESPSARA